MGRSAGRASVVISTSVPSTRCFNPNATARTRYRVPAWRPSTGTVVMSPLTVTAGVSDIADGGSAARRNCTATLSVRWVRMEATALSTLCGFAATVASSITGAGRDPTGPSLQAAPISAAAIQAWRRMLLRRPLRSGFGYPRGRRIAAILPRDDVIRVHLERIDGGVAEALRVRRQRRDRRPVAPARVSV